MLSLLLLLVAVAAPAGAQWLHYPTAGVPKGGVLAPTPRGSDGKSDFSGLWLSTGQLPCPKFMRDDRGECAEKTGLTAQSMNLGAGLSGGLPYQPWAAELTQKRTREQAKDDPHARCLPTSFPRAYALPHIQKFIQTRGLLVVLNEFNAEYRQIFLDGRRLPKDPQPSWNGYSTGHWEGDALVVVTNGLRDDLWLDMQGSPLTEVATITERFRRPNFGTLEVELTVNDPKAYTRPWTARIKQGIVLDTELLEEICLENEQSVQHMPKN